MIRLTVKENHICSVVNKILWYRETFYLVKNQKIIYNLFNFRWQKLEVEIAYITNTSFLDVPSLVGKRGWLIVIPVWLTNQLTFAGLEPVLSHTEK